MTDIGEPTSGGSAVLAVAAAPPPPPAAVHPVAAPAPAPVAPAGSGPLPWPIHLAGAAPAPSATPVVAPNATAADGGKDATAAQSSIAAMPDGPSESVQPPAAAARQSLSRLSSVAHDVAADVNAMASDKSKEATGNGVSPGSGSAPRVPPASARKGAPPALRGNKFKFMLNTLSYKRLQNIICKLISGSVNVEDVKKRVPYKVRADGHCAVYAFLIGYFGVQAVQQLTPAELEVAVKRIRRVAAKACDKVVAWLRERGLMVEEPVAEKWLKMWEGNTPLTHEHIAVLATAFGVNVDIFRPAAGEDDSFETMRILVNEGAPTIDILHDGVVHFDALVACDDLDSAKQLLQEAVALSLMFKIAVATTGSLPSYSQKNVVDSCRLAHLLLNAAKWEISVEDLLQFATNDSDVTTRLILLVKSAFGELCLDGLTPKSRVLTPAAVLYLAGWLMLPVTVYERVGGAYRAVTLSVAGAKMQHLHLCGTKADGDSYAWEVLKGVLDVRPSAAVSSTAPARLTPASSGGVPVAPSHVATSATAAPPVEPSSAAASTKRKHASTASATGNADSAAPRGGVAATGPHRAGAGNGQPQPREQLSTAAPAAPSTSSTPTLPALGADDSRKQQTVKATKAAKAKKGAAAAGTLQAAATGGSAAMTALNSTSSLSKKAPPALQAEAVASAPPASLTSKPSTAQGVNPQCTAAAPVALSPVLPVSDAPGENSKVKVAAGAGGVGVSSEHKVREGERAAEDSQQQQQQQQQAPASAEFKAPSWTQYANAEFVRIMRKEPRKQLLVRLCRARAAKAAAAAVPAARPTAASDTNARYTKTASAKAVAERVTFSIAWTVEPKQASSRKRPDAVAVRKPLQLCLLLLLALLALAVLSPLLIPVLLALLPLFLLLPSSSRNLQKKPSLLAPLLLLGLLSRSLQRSQKKEEEEATTVPSPTTARHYRKSRLTVAQHIVEGVKYLSDRAGLAKKRIKKSKASCAPSTGPRKATATKKSGTKAGADSKTPAAETPPSGPDAATTPAAGTPPSGAAPSTAGPAKKAESSTTPAAGSPPRSAQAAAPRPGDENDDADNHRCPVCLSPRFLGWFLLASLRVLARLLHHLFYWACHASLTTTLALVLLLLLQVLPQLQPLLPSPSKVLQRCPLLLRLLQLLSVAVIVSFLRELEPQLRPLLPSPLQVLQRSPYLLYLLCLLRLLPLPHEPSTIKHRLSALPPEYEAVSHRGSPPAEDGDNGTHAVLQAQGAAGLLPPKELSKKKRCWARKRKLRAKAAADAAAEVAAEVAVEPAASTLPPGWLRGLATVGKALTVTQVLVLGKAGGLSLTVYVCDASGACTSYALVEAGGGVPAALRLMNGKYELLQWARGPGKKRGCRRKKVAARHGPVSSAGSCNAPTGAAVSAQQQGAPTQASPSDVPAALATTASAPPAAGGGPLHLQPPRPAAPVTAQPAAGGLDCWFEASLCVLSVVVGPALAASSLESVVKRLSKWFPHGRRADARLAVLAVVSLLQATFATLQKQQLFAVSFGSAIAAYDDAVPAVIVVDKDGIRAGEVPSTSSTSSGGGCERRLACALLYDAPTAEAQDGHWRAVHELSPHDTGMVMLRVYICDAAAGKTATTRACVHPSASLLHPLQLSTTPTDTFHIAIDGAGLLYVSDAPLEGNETGNVAASVPLCVFLGGTKHRTLADLDSTVVAESAIGAAARSSGGAAIAPSAASSVLFAVALRGVPEVLKAVVESHEEAIPDGCGVHAVLKDNNSALHAVIAALGLEITASDLRARLITWVRSHQDRLIEAKVVSSDGFKKWLAVLVSDNALLPSHVAALAIALKYNLVLHDGIKAHTYVTAPGSPVLRLTIDCVTSGGAAASSLESIYYAPLLVNMTKVDALWRKVLDHAVSFVMALKDHNVSEAASAGQVAGRMAGEEGFAGFEKELPCADLVEVAGPFDGDQLDFALAHNKLLNPTQIRCLAALLLQAQAVEVIELRCPALHGALVNASAVAQIWLAQVEQAEGLACLPTVAQQGERMASVAGPVGVDRTYIERGVQRYSCYANSSGLMLHQLSELPEALRPLAAQHRVHPGAAAAASDAGSAPARAAKLLHFFEKIRAKQRVEDMDLPCPANNGFATQEDLPDYMRLILDDVAPSTGYLFTTTMLKHSRCRSCNVVAASSSASRILEVQAPVEQASPLSFQEQLIAAMSAPADADHACFTCSRRGVMEAHGTFVRTPDQFFVSLARFTQRGHTFLKDAREWAFAACVDLRDATLGGVAEGSRYFIEGFACHRGGTLEEGHYVVYLPSARRADGTAASWVLVNDDLVSGPMSTEAVLTSADVKQGSCMVLLRREAGAAEANNTMVDDSEDIGGMSAGSAKSVGAPGGSSSAEKPAGGRVAKMPGPMAAETEGGLPVGVAGGAAAAAGAAAGAVMEDVEGVETAASASSSSSALTSSNPAAHRVLPLAATSSATLAAGTAQPAPGGGHGLPTAARWGPPPPSAFDEAVFSRCFAAILASSPRVFIPPTGSIAATADGRRLVCEEPIPEGFKRGPTVGPAVDSALVSVINALGLCGTAAELGANMYAWACNNIEGLISANIVDRVTFPSWVGLFRTGGEPLTDSHVAAVAAAYQCHLELYVPKLGIAYKYATGGSSDNVLRLQVDRGGKRVKFGGGLYTPCEIDARWVQKMWPAVLNRAASCVDTMGDVKNAAAGGAVAGTAACATGCAAFFDELPLDDGVSELQLAVPGDDPLEFADWAFCTALWPREKVRALCTLLASACNGKRHCAARVALLQAKSAADAWEAKLQRAEAAQGQPTTQTTRHLSALAPLLAQLWAPLRRAGQSLLTADVVAKIVDAIAPALSRDGSLRGGQADALPVAAELLDKPALISNGLTTVACKACGGVSTALFDTATLHVPPRGGLSTQPVSFQAQLSGMFLQHAMQAGFRCPTCQRINTSVKTCELTRTPDQMFVSLKRARACKPDTLPWAFPEDGVVHVGAADGRGAAPGSLHAIEGISGDCDGGAFVYLPTMRGQDGIVDTWSCFDGSGTVVRTGITTSTLLALPAMTTGACTLLLRRLAAEVQAVRGLPSGVPLPPQEVAAVQEVGAVQEDGAMEEDGAMQDDEATYEEEAVEEVSVHEEQAAVEPPAKRRRLHSPSVVRPALQQLATAINQPAGAGHAATSGGIPARGGSQRRTVGSGSSRAAADTMSQSEVLEHEAEHQSGRGSYPGIYATRSAGRAGFEARLYALGGSTTGSQSTSIVGAVTSCISAMEASGNTLVAALGRLVQVGLPFLSFLAPLATALVGSCAPPMQQQVPVAPVASSSGTQDPLGVPATSVLELGDYWLPLKFPSLATLAALGAVPTARGATGPSRAPSSTAPGAFVLARVNDVPQELPRHSRTVVAGRIYQAGVVISPDALPFFYVNAAPQPADGFAYVMLVEAVPALSPLDDDRPAIVCVPCNSLRPLPLPGGEEPAAASSSGAVSFSDGAKRLHWWQTASATALFDPATTDCSCVTTTGRFMPSVDTAREVAGALADPGFQAWLKSKEPLCKDSVMPLIQQVRDTVSSDVPLTFHFGKHGVLTGSSQLPVSHGEMTGTDSGGAAGSRRRPVSEVLAERLEHYQDYHRKLAEATHGDGAAAAAAAAKARAPLVTPVPDDTPLRHCNGPAGPAYGAAADAARHAVLPGAHVFLHLRSSEFAHVAAAARSHLRQADFAVIAAARLMQRLAGIRRVVAVTFIESSESTFDTDFSDRPGHAELVDAVKAVKERCMPIVVFATFDRVCRVDPLGAVADLQAAGAHVFVGGISAGQRHDLGLLAVEEGLPPPEFIDAGIPLIDKSTQKRKAEGYLAHVVAASISFFHMLHGPSSAAVMALHLIAPVLCELVPGITTLVSLARCSEGSATTWGQALLASLLTVLLRAKEVHSVLLEDTPISVSAKGQGTLPSLLKQRFGEAADVSDRLLAAVSVDRLSRVEGGLKGGLLPLFPRILLSLKPVADLRAEVEAAQAALPEGTSRVAAMVATLLTHFNVSPTANSDLWAAALGDAPPASSKDTLLLAALTTLAQCHYLPAVDSKATGSVLAPHILTWEVVEPDTDVACGLKAFAEVRAKMRDAATASELRAAISGSGMGDANALPRGEPGDEAGAAASAPHASRSEGGSGDAKARPGPRTRSRAGAVGEAGSAAAGATAEAGSAAAGATVEAAAAAAAAAAVKAAKALMLRAAAAARELTLERGAHGCGYEYLLEDDAAIILAVRWQKLLPYVSWEVFWDAIATALQLNRSDVVLRKRYTLENLDEIPTTEPVGFDDDILALVSQYPRGWKRIARVLKETKGKNFSWLGVYLAWLRIKVERADDAKRAEEAGAAVAAAAVEAAKALMLRAAAAANELKRSWHIRGYEYLLEDDAAIILGARWQKLLPPQTQDAFWDAIATELQPRRSGKMLRQHYALENLDEIPTTEPVGFDDDILALVSQYPRGWKRIARVLKETKGKNFSWLGVYLAWLRIKVERADDAKRAEEAGAAAVAAQAAAAASAAPARR